MPKRKLLPAQKEMFAAMVDRRGAWQFNGPIYVAGYDIFRHFFKHMDQAEPFFNTKRYKAFNGLMWLQIKALIVEEFSKIRGADIVFLDGFLEDYSAEFLANNNMLFVIADKQYSVEKLKTFAFSNGNKRYENLAIKPIATRTMILPDYFVLTSMASYNLLRNFMIACFSASPLSNNPIDNAPPPYVKPGNPLHHCEQTVLTFPGVDGAIESTCPNVAKAWRAGFGSARYNPVLLSTKENAEQVRAVHAAYPRHLGPLDRAVARKQVVWRRNHGLQTPALPRSAEGGETYQMTVFSHLTSSATERRHFAILQEEQMNCDSVFHGEQQCLIPAEVAREIESIRLTELRQRRSNRTTALIHSALATIENSESKQEERPTYLQRIATDAGICLVSAATQGFCRVVVKRLFQPYLISCGASLTQARLVSGSLLLALRTALFGVWSGVVGMGARVVIAKALDCCDFLTAQQKHCLSNLISIVMSSWISFTSSENFSDALFSHGLSVVTGGLGAMAGEKTATQFVQYWKRQAKDDLEQKPESSNWMKTR